MKNQIYALLFCILTWLMLPANSSAQNCTVNAGLDQTICASSALTLYGTTAGLFTGGTTWTQVSGPSLIITSPTSLTTTVTGYSGGNTYKFWLNANCQDGSLVHDECIVIVRPITTANAGPDQTLCPGSPAGSLSANALGAGESGAWTTIGTTNGTTVVTLTNPTSAINLSQTKSGATTLRWTITNTNGCTSTDDVIITDLGGVSPVNAGPDILLATCYTTTTTATMAATFGGSGGGQSGLWTVVSGPNIPVITTPASEKTTVTNLIQGTYTLRWTVSGGCLNGSDDVQIIVPAPTQSLTSLSSASTQTFCDSRTTAVLTQKSPALPGETGVWSWVSGPAGYVITSPNSPTTTVTGLNGLAGSTYVFKYTISNTYGCSASANSTIAFVAPAAAVNAGPDQILACGVSTASLPYTFSGGNNTQYRIVSGPAGTTYTFPTSFTTTTSSPLSVIGLTANGTYVIELVRSVSNATNTCPPVLDQVNVTTSFAPSGSTSGTKQVLACNVVSTALAGNVPTSGLGTWYQSSGPNTASLASLHAYNSGISSLIPGTYVFRWLISGGPYCPTTQDDVSVVVANAQPTTAQAGADQTACYGTPIQLYGNTPALNETGTWSVSPTTGVIFSDVNNPSATVTLPDASTSYSLTWKITNACGTSSDVAKISTTETNGPIQSIAGTDQCLTAGTTQVTLSGNNPSPGTGRWTKVSGGSATITDPTLSNTTVTGMTNGSYTFEWAITRGAGCIVTRDTLMITISGGVTAANAGPDQTICGNSATLAANTPTAGTGSWSLVSGPAGYTMVNPLLPNTAIHNMASGVYTFRWTISNGNAACTPSTDDVVLYISTPPSAANAGVDKSVCGGTSTTLAGTEPTSGTGLWSVVSGPNVPTITTLNSATSTVTGLLEGTYILRWNVTSGPYCLPSTDDVQIFVVPTASTAGNTTTYCGVNSIQLSGNAGSTGTWTQNGSTPNTATITTTGPNTATASDLIPGTYSFIYTIPLTGSCAQTTASLSVTISAPGTTAVAGPDQNVCRSGSSVVVTLAGNTATTGTGTWSKISGPLGGTTFSPNRNTPGATVSLTNVGTYVYAWTIANGSCSTQDQVIINVDVPATAYAGEAQNVCGTTASLSATAVLAPRVGTWTQDSGPNAAAFSSTILNNPTVSNLITGTYVFRWTVTGGICAPTTDFSTVSIAVSMNPTSPDAGPDQNLCGASNVTMAGNAISVGTGAWSQVGSTPSAIISDPGNPQTLISLTGGTGSYTFQWTATNGLCSLSDQVIINNNPAPPTANAGENQSLCQFQDLNLSANSPLPGTGLWSVVSGTPTPTILDPTNNNTRVIGVDVGVYVFRWTTSTPNCTSSSDDVEITIHQIPTAAAAGPDQTGALTCGLTSVLLAGNNPSVGTGHWSIVSGTGGSFVNDNNYNTTFNGTPGESYVLLWTITNGPCFSMDEMNVTFNNSADVSIIKTGPSTIEPGGLITYTLTVTNTGPCNASNTTVTDIIPSSIADPQYYNGTAWVTWTGSRNIGTINSGGNYSFQIRGTLTSDCITSVENTATVASTITDPSPANNTSSVTTTVNYISLFWSGLVNTEWSNPGNWIGNNVPSPSDNVFIPQGSPSNPVLLSGTAIICNDLVIGGSLVINEGASLTVNGVLTICGNLTVEPGGSLITSCTVRGTATIKRQIDSDMHWHLLSSPVSNQSVCNDIFAPSVSNFPGDVNSWDFYKWLANCPTGPSDEHWRNLRTASQGINYTDFGTPPEFGVTKGYLVAYGAGFPTVKSFVGNPNTCDKVCSFFDIYTECSWELAGNPFPSAVDWSLVTGKSNLVNDYYYVWNENKAGGAGYEWWSDNTHKSSLMIDGKIPPMQGFFIKVDLNGSKQIGLPNSSRVHDVLADMWLKDASFNKLSIKLSNGTNYDETFVIFENNGSIGLDRNDAEKLFSMYPGIPQVYTIINNDMKASMNSMPFITSGATIPVGFIAPAQGNYSITAGNVSSFTSLTGLVLEDLKLNVSQNLMLNPVYNFTAAGNEDAGRFLLHFAGAIGIDEKGSNQISIYSNEKTVFITGAANAQVTISNLLGQEFVARKLSNQTINQVKVNALKGYYIVKVQNESSVKTSKVFIN